MLPSPTQKTFKLTQMAYTEQIQQPFKKILLRAKTVLEGQLNYNGDGRLESRASNGISESLADEGNVADNAKGELNGAYAEDERFFN